MVSGQNSQYTSTSTGPIQKGEGSKVNMWTHHGKDLDRSLERNKVHLQVLHTGSPHGFSKEARQVG